MPVVRLAYPRGALTQAQQRTLAADLTDVVLQGLLEDERWNTTHRRIAEAFQCAVDGMPSADPMLALRVWVLVHEVREGSWGAAGTTMWALDVAQLINPDLDGARRGEIAAAVRADG
jgi:phenylpyruvate tautomerase PptA (4-oxalocrotonate tautomerase family)